MIKRVLIALALLLISLVPAYVSAADDIRLLSSDTKIDFPNSLTFNIKADSPATINRVRLRYQVDEKTYAPSYAEAWPEFQPAKNISTSWTWDMRKGSLPPGAKITYWWVIQDDAGDQFTSPQDTVYFDDTRYKWQNISDQMITLYWYQGSNSFAGELLKAAVAARARLENDAGVVLDKPVSIYIYTSYDDLRGSIVAPQEWTGGVAYFAFNIIAIGISPDNLDWGKEALAHEMGHLVTHQVTNSPYVSELPPWLDEGLAMHAQGPQSDSDKAALKKAIADGTIATLETLSSPFSADPNEAFYSYAESRSVIEYLVSNFGKNKINELLVVLNDGNTMDNALMKVYGFDLNGLDKAWMDWLMSQPSKNTGASAKTLFLTVGAWLNPSKLTYAGATG